MHTTFSGNKALLQDEPLIFELSDRFKTGVDFIEEQTQLKQHSLSSFINEEIIDLPGLSEPQTIRHYTRLSQLNYGIDSGFFPLGSCTMKHNPRINEKIARMSGIADIHPMQPVSSVQGFLEMIDDLGNWFKELTGMTEINLSLAAGAQGELCGILAIKQALKQKGLEHKNIILVADSAHGTNPATAVACGFKVQEVKSNKWGRVDIEDLKAKLNEQVAGIMLTNPSTCGLFEKNIKEIADLIHQNDAYFYCDGANLNALIGRVKPGDLGIDAMHINIHKTFSTPHGGGGPGGGPTVFSSRLAQFVPLPWVEKCSDGSYDLIENELPIGSDKIPLGRLKQFHGQTGLLVRALAYILSHGLDGLRQATEDAVLNANYILSCLKDFYSVPFGIEYCMHEVMLSEESIAKNSISTFDMAKALIDEGYHPMTVYFPLVVKGAMLIEPTESESKDTLDKFCNVMIELAKATELEDKSRFKQAPFYSPRRRVDEVKAARNPILTWKMREENSSN